MSTAELQTGLGDKNLAPSTTGTDEVPVRTRAERHRLPAERRSVTHRFMVGEHKGYFTVGLYPDGEPGELFITMAKEGSSVSGLMSSFAQVISVALQHGVPLVVFCEKFTHTRFEPSGFTGNPEIPIASSIMDYIFRWLRLRFIEHRSTLPQAPPARVPDKTSPAVISPLPVWVASDAPFCVRCESLMIHNGACFLCHNCGHSSGCG